jgi:8-amino-7-oxononanoate synthase
VADFTSSLYLGMRHAAAELPRWTALTTGRPSVLGRPPAARRVAQQLAALQGAERALLARSTLHAFADCLDVLAGAGSGLVVDTGLYPVARWAVQRAAGLGVPVASAAHRDLGDLARALDGHARHGLRPVVLADGVCGGCGRPYPLGAALPRVRAHGGILLIDDTQAVGLFGSRADRAHPFGRGGGGSVCRSGVPFHDVVAVASLAKAFGAPVAAVAGPDEIVRTVERLGGAAMHSSPPSTVDVAAAARALERNAHEGDALRGRLARRIRALRLRCAGRGLHLAGGLFPVQATPQIGVGKGRDLLDRLAARDVRAVLRRGCGNRSAVVLVLTARHGVEEVTAAADALVAAWSAGGCRVG